MVISDIFQIASNVSTPLGLAGLISTIFFYIIWQMIRKQHTSPSISQLILKYLFLLSLIAMILGFSGYIFINSPNNHTKKISIKGTVNVDGVERNHLQVKISELEKTELTNQYGNFYMDIVPENGQKMYRINFHDNDIDSSCIINIDSTVDHFFLYSKIVKPLNLSVVDTLKVIHKGKHEIRNSPKPKPPIFPDSEISKLFESNFAGTYTLSGYKTKDDGNCQIRRVRNEIFELFATFKIDEPGPAFSCIISGKTKFTFRISNENGYNWERRKNSPSEINSEVNVRIFNAQNLPVTNIRLSELNISAKDNLLELIYDVGYPSKSQSFVEGINLTKKLN